MKQFASFMAAEPRVFSTIIGTSHLSMSLDFMMWFFAAVTFHGPKVKSCLLLLNMFDIIIGNRQLQKKWKKKKNSKMCFPTLNYLNKCSVENILTQFEGQGHSGFICSHWGKTKQVRSSAHVTREIAICSLPDRYPEIHNQEGIHLKKKSGSKSFIE